MKYNQRIGKFGEILVKNYLVRHKYDIISLNEKISFKEIDIIAKKDKKIIFVEVKTRSSNIYGDSVDSFNVSKMNNLKTAIEKYIFENKINEKYLQIDLIAVDINRPQKTAKIKHFKNIF